jgi:hypothetical protein
MKAMFKSKKGGRDSSPGPPHITPPRPQVGWADTDAYGSPSKEKGARVAAQTGEYSAAVDFAEMLLKPGMPALDAIADLKVTLRAASKTWLEHFYDAGGLTALVMKLSDVEVSELFDALFSSCIYVYTYMYIYLGE